MQRLPGIMRKKKQQRASANKTARGCARSALDVTFRARQKRRSIKTAWTRWRPAHLCPSVSSSSMGALMTFFFSVACSSIIRRAPSKSWGKSFLDTVSCISSRRVSIWVAWPENSSNATRTWRKAQQSSLLHCVRPILQKTLICTRHYSTFV